MNMYFVPFALVWAIGSAISVNVGSDFPDSRERLSFDEIHQGMLTLKEQYQMVQTDLDDVAKVTGSLGIDMDTVMKQIEEKARQSLGDIEEVLGEAHAKAIAHVVALAELAKSKEEGAHHDTENGSVSFLQEIAAVLKAQPKDYDYSRIKDVLGKWLASLRPARKEERTDL